MNEHTPPEPARIWFDTGTLRVAEFRLAAGTAGTAHLHSAVTELCICLEGGVVVTRQGCPPLTLEPGQRIEIPAGQIHRLSGARDTACRYLVIQGIGVYDFIIV